MAIYKPETRAHFTKTELFTEMLRTIAKAALRPFVYGTIMAM
jgi:hypothetical protein